jgi:hypothetical protein
MLLFRGVLRIIICPGKIEVKALVDFPPSFVSLLISMKIVSAGQTNIGRKRKVNQDSFLMEPATRLFVVADGMGGHAGGETASKLTVETVIQSILNDKPRAPAVDYYCQSRRENRCNRGLFVLRHRRSFQSRIVPRGVGTVPSQNSLSAVSCAQIATGKSMTDLGQEEFVLNTENEGS